MSTVVIIRRVIELQEKCQSLEQIVFDNNDIVVDDLIQLHDNPSKLYLDPRIQTRLRALRCSKKELHFFQKLLRKTRSALLVRLRVDLPKDCTDITISYNEGDVVSLRYTTELYKRNEIIVVFDLYR